MVTTASAKRTIATDAWTTISVAAACANRPREIPGHGDTFTVHRSSHQDELTKLMPVLEAAGASYGVRQAAIWIVTDDASYFDLGTLLSRPQYQMTGGTRVIQESEAAEAMRICERAGIDLERKRIWRDRAVISSGVRDPKLREWLAGKG